MKMRKWRCTVCGEIVESNVRPERCPLCKAPGEKFVEVFDNEEMTWATEHEVGISKRVFRKKSSKDCALTSRANVPKSVCTSQWQE